MTATKDDSHYAWFRGLTLRQKQMFVRYALTIIKDEAKKIADDFEVPTWMKPVGPWATPSSFFAADKMLHMDEYSKAKRKTRRAVAEIILTGRPTLVGSKGKIVKAALKKANKRRKKRGLPKLKYVELKLPKGVKVTDAMGYQQKEPT